jgi:3'(2'), 5'-bisphosphate nucleotidase
MTAQGQTQAEERLRLACAIAGIASRAGATIMRIGAGSHVPRKKSDDSAVTDADEAAEALILEELARLMPGVPIVAEEAAARKMPPLPGGSYFLVDPLDGTREFVDGRDEYTVNIALIEAHEPVLGVIYAPRMDALYVGAAANAFRGMIVPGMPFDRGAALPIHVRPRRGGLVAFVREFRPAHRSSSRASPKAPLISMRAL